MKIVVQRYLLSSTEQLGENILKKRSNFVVLLWMKSVMIWISIGIDDDCCSTMWKWTTKLNSTTGMMTSGLWLNFFDETISTMWTFVILNSNSQNWSTKKIFIPKHGQYEFDICDNNNRARLWPFLLSLSIFKIDTPVKTWRMKYIFKDFAIGWCKNRSFENLDAFFSTVLYSWENEKSVEGNKRWVKNDHWEEKRKGKNKMDVDVELLERNLWIQRMTSHHSSN